MTVTKENIIDVIKTVYDPEIPVNIWDLGLIYDIDIKDIVTITMTFTSPTCPMMEELLSEVQTKTEAIAGKDKVKIELVWNPPWDISRMSQVARLELDLTDQGW